MDKGLVRHRGTSAQRVGGHKFLTEASDAAGQKKAGPKKNVGTPYYLTEVVGVLMNGDKRQKVW